MYVGGSAYGATRIYNPNPDPAEQGPPKRVNREEAHIGEMVAASKRRITWQFTLGEGETIHEVMLVHSIMSYKKTVEYDGRHMHFSSTATPGDWCFSMLLEGANYVIEVRINDTETDDIPKYDLVIDRVPFRRWDVFRRRKPQPGGSTGYNSSYSSQHALHPPSTSFGAHKWGPDRGSISEPPAITAHQGYHTNYNRNEQHTRSETSSTYLVPPTSQPKPAIVQQAPPPPPPKQEIDLIGDFGVETTSSPIPQSTFDPFALGNTSNSTQGFNAPPPPAPVPAAQPYVDPFANTNQPLPIAKPNLTQINLDPLASQNSTYLQRNPNQNTPAFPSANTMPQQAPPQGFGMGMNTMGMAMGGANPGVNMNPMGMAPVQQYQSPQQGFRMNPGGGMPVHPTQPYGNAPPPSGMPVHPTQPYGSAPPPNKPIPGGVNYNISQLMNPMDVNNSNNLQQTKTINIDPFAGMSK